MILFVNNSTFNLISFIVAIISSILSVVFYIKSNRIKKPRYMIRTISWLAKQEKDETNISLSFGDRLLNGISTTKVAIWNDGKDTISKADVATTNPLQIVIDGQYEILEADIIYVKNKSNNFSLSLDKDNKAAIINFEYFDKGEGAIVRLRHTAPIGKAINLSGSIKSVRKIECVERYYKSNSRDTKTRKKTRKAISWIYILLGAISIVESIIKFCKISLSPNLPNIEMNSNLVGVVFLIYGIILLCLPLLLFGHRVPKGFDSFDSSDF